MQMHHFRGSTTPIFSQIRSVGPVRLIRAGVDPGECEFPVAAPWPRPPRAPAPSRFHIRRPRPHPFPREWLAGGPTWGDASSDGSWYASPRSLGLSLWNDSLSEGRGHGMSRSTAEVVICGAGIAGIAAAYHLSVRSGVKDVVLVDQHPPLSLTSDKSTECYRNWWPGPGNAMVALMNRSIDIMEDLAHQSGNVFHLNRRGYLYLTADPNKVAAMTQAAFEPSGLGAGQLRTHTGEPGEHSYLPSSMEEFEGQPTGADLILDPNLIREHFPYLSDRTVAALHARRAGWFSAQQLGIYLLDQARANGVRVVNAQLTQVRCVNNRVHSVVLDNGDILATRNFVNAGGPFLRDIGHLLGLDLPVQNEL